MVTSAPGRPGRWDLTLYQGDDWSGQATILEDGVVVADLTGETWRAQIRAAVSSSAILATIDVTIPSPTTGVVVLKLTGAQTAALGATVGDGWVWDLERTRADGRVMTVLAGQVHVAGEVTR